MKKLYPIITATSLVFIASLAGYHLPATGDRSPVIPVFIPDDTKVSLKNGASLSGRLIKFDSQAKMIALGRESKTKEVAMKEIEQIEFQGKVIIRESQSLVISERLSELQLELEIKDEVARNQQQNRERYRERWQEPLQNFRIVDVNQGKAEVTLTSLNPRQIGYIISDVLRNSSYVVEEIKFNPSDKIGIQVNRCVATYQYGMCYN
jgi:small nuclear ribonucleoprotein (snRNP)-like protein